MYKRIFAPIDGTDTARPALVEAIALAALLKAVLRLPHVVNNLAVLMGMSSAIHLRQYHEGPREAKAPACDLIVIGTHGRHRRHP